MCSSVSNRYDGAHNQRYWLAVGAQPTSQLCDQPQPQRAIRREGVGPGDTCGRACIRDLDSCLGCGGGLLTGHDGSADDGSVGNESEVCGTKELLNCCLG